MSRTNERIRESRRLAVGLGLSGAALVGLIYFEGMSARAVAEADEDDFDELAAFAVEDVDVVHTPVPVAVEVEVASAAVDVAAELPAAPLGPALVMVPDIERMNVRKAARQIAAVGLKLSVRDDYGERVPRELWSEYEVLTQELDAGTEVVPGATVKAKARVPRRYASGY